MDAALIGSVFAGLVGILGAVFNYLLNKEKADARDVDELADEVAALRAQLETAMRHIHTLRIALARTEIQPPPLPEELTERRRVGKHNTSRR